MSQFVPGGLTGLVEKAGGAYAILNGVGASTLLPLLTVASPRMVGEFINVMGWTAEKATKVFTALGVSNAAVFVASALNNLPKAETQNK